MGASGPGTPLLFDLTGRGDVAVGGKDRVAFLQGLVTNDVKALRPGQGAPAALLSPKGKLVAVMTVLCREEELLLDTEPELAAPLEALLKKYVFFQEVVIENRTSEKGVLHLEGDRGETEDLLRGLIGGTAVPSAAHEHIQASLRLPPSFSFDDGPPEAVPVCVVLEARGGSHGFDVRVERADRAAALSFFESAGLRPSPLPLLESARIEAGIPRWGAELTPDVLPDEAGLPARGWVSYTKGCYVGQEIVARIRTYGHVNRSLVGFFMDAPPPAAGDEIRVAGSRTGAVTSAALAAHGGRAVGLGYVRREHAAPGAPLSIVTREGERLAAVTLLPQPIEAGRPSR